MATDPIKINDPSISEPATLQDADRLPLGRPGGSTPLVSTLSKLAAWIGAKLGIESLQSASHTHANKSALDKITESAGAPLWNGAAWPGGGGVQQPAIVEASDLETALALSTPGDGILYVVPEE